MNQPLVIMLAVALGAVGLLLALTTVAAFVVSGRENEDWERWVQTQAALLDASAKGDYQADQTESE